MAVSRVTIPLSGIIKKKKKKLREEGEGRFDRKERPCLFDRAALEWFIRVEEK